MLMISRLAVFIIASVAIYHVSRISLRSYRFHCIVLSGDLGFFFIRSIVTARVEEKENVLYFGDGYSDYMKRTKMFIPFVM